MKIFTGIDIVNISRFRKTLKREESHFQLKVFHPEESENKSAVSLAGIFAAKEAIIKALNLKAGSWLKIKISSSNTGKPQIKLIEDLKLNIVSSDISISHEPQYAIASATFLINEL